MAAHEKRPASQNKTIVIVAVAFVVIIFLCVLACVCVNVIGFGASWLRDRYSVDVVLPDLPTPNSTTKGSTSSGQTTTALTTAISEDGMIEGALSFPSEGIPSTLQVCAENVSDEFDYYCTQQQIESGKYQYGVGYQLTVPAGTYYVYAEDTPNPGYRGLYSEYVTCGMGMGCESHEQIPVTVYAGQTESNIDLFDWYAP